MGRVDKLSSGSAEEGGQRSLALGGVSSSESL